MAESRRRCVRAEALADVALEQLADQVDGDRRHALRVGDGA